MIEYVAVAVYERGYINPSIIKLADSIEQFILPIDTSVSLKLLTKEQLEKLEEAREVLVLCLD